MIAYRKIRNCTRRCVACHAVHDKSKMYAVRSHHIAMDRGKGRASTYQKFPCTYYYCEECRPASSLTLGSRILLKLKGWLRKL